MKISQCSALRGALGHLRLADRREPGRALRLVGIDLVGVAKREADIVEAVEQSVLREIVDLERNVEPDRRRGHALVLDVDDDFELRIFLRSPPTTGARRLGTVAATSPILPLLLRKMSANRGRALRAKP
jgi:hypothetical protein